MKMPSTAQRSVAVLVLTNRICMMTSIEVMMPYFILNYDTDERLSVSRGDHPRYGAKAHNGPSLARGKSSWRYLSRQFMLMPVL